MESAPRPGYHTSVSADLARLRSDDKLRRSMGLFITGKDAVAIPVHSITDVLKF